MGILSDLIRAPIGQAPSRGRGIRDNRVPSMPSVTPPPLFESLRGITKRPEEQRFIERLDNEPIRDITTNFVPPALGRATTSPIAPPPVVEYQILDLIHLQHQT